MRHTRLLTPLLALCLLTSCAERASTPPAIEPDETHWYQQAKAAGRQVLTIDSAQSLITVTVRRGGLLSQFGHDHVVASRGITGFAAVQDGRADFQFRLDQMSVDEPALRRAAGLDTDPDAEAIAGTRRNMLGKVLEADRYPLVLLHAQRSGELTRLTITLHGVTRDYSLPVAVDSSAAALVASGSLALKQSDFGITPMSVMGGAIKVEDTLALRFRIVAN